MPGAGQSFFVFGRNQYHRKLRTHVDSTEVESSTTASRGAGEAAARNKALRASTLLEAVGVTRIKACIKALPTVRLELHSQVL